MHCIARILLIKRGSDISQKKHTQLTETNKPTGCSQTSAKQQTTVEEQEVGYYNIMMASQFPW